MCHGGRGRLKAVSNAQSGTNLVIGSARLSIEAHPMTAFMCGVALHGCLRSAAERSGVEA